MKLVAFRIKNFRSIIDSRWVPLSPDGITVFVGQNESGKSSVLDALYFSLSGNTPTEDDFRIGAPFPSVTLRIESDSSMMDSFDGLFNDAQLKSLNDFFELEKFKIDLEVNWDYEVKEGKRQLLTFVKLAPEKIKQLNDELEKVKIPKEQSSLPAAAAAPNAAPAADTVPSTDSVVPPVPKPNLSANEVADGIWQELPLGVLFNDVSGHLPNQVDIDEKGNLTGAGSAAAKNFLKLAEVDLAQLLKGDRRARENTLNRANAKVSADFNSFWSQTIGRQGQLALKCDLDYYDATVEGKAGKPHLVFWICDGNTQLYPKQRSQGVRWFISFYLQLKASEKSKTKRVFLLDEPGANLHSKAQGDVLKLINGLGKDTSTVLYSTHSPQLLEYPKLFRVHAVQRTSDLDDSPSFVINAHHLGTASTDTLSPVLSAMGVDLSHHQVIRRDNNVLLEEMSAFYYLSAFWKLTNQKKLAHFIATTGVNKIEAFANMFRGWGLDFIIAVDDDKQGREAYKSIKRELFGNDDSVADRKIFKLPGCPAVEDAFSQDDFKKLILSDSAAKIVSTNGEYLKQIALSKPVLGYQFHLQVEDKTITLDQLDAVTQANVGRIVEAIASRIN